MRGQASSRRRRLRQVALVPVLVLTVAATAGSAGPTELVSRATDGAQPNAYVWDAAASGDGNIVAFWSLADNLVPNDTNGSLDVFVRDRAAGTTERASVASDGAQATGQPETLRFQSLAMSSDGRYVAFVSDATNLVPNDTNGAADAFVHDRTTGVTERVSVTAAGAQGNGATSKVAISDDGSRVAFVSDASNLVAGDTNGVADAFVRDRAAGTTVRASVTGAGGQLSGSTTDLALSGDGNAVGFMTDAPELEPGTPHGDEVYVRDLAAAQTELVTEAAGGGPANGDQGVEELTPDGRYVLLDSTSTDLVAGGGGDFFEVYVRDRATGTTVRASPGRLGDRPHNDAFAGGISDDGSVVSFASSADNLVSGDRNGQSDVFARKLPNGPTQRISVSVSGGDPNGGSFDPALTADAAEAVFTSRASDLVADDENGSIDDVFARTVGPFGPSRGACTITGSMRSDHLVGTPGRDVICALAGDDTVEGLGGDDVIFAGKGDDVVDGGPGNDRIHGGDGADQLAGGRGDDRVYGNIGADRVDGGPGNDLVHTADGKPIDSLDGGAGRDTCASDPGDTVTGCP